LPGINEGDTYQVLAAAGQGIFNGVDGKRRRRTVLTRRLDAPGMGHDLPSGAWPRVVDAIAAHTERVR